MASQAPSPAAPQDKLARTKLAIETLLKRRDQELAQKQFELAQSQFAFQREQNAKRGWGLLLSPTGVVLLGAALGLLGTAAGKWADYITTKRQQETSIILKASDVPQALSPELQDIQRARNLLWFAQAHYIDLPNSFISQLQEASKIPAGQKLPSPVIQSAFNSPLPAPTSAVDLLSSFEGFHQKAIQDQNGLWTIGIGHVLSPTELSSKRINLGQKSIDFTNGISLPEAKEILQVDLAESYKAIDALVKVPLTPQQRDALASFVFNVGKGRFATSTLLVKLNQGKYDEVPQQLAFWSHPNGISNPGLQMRRAREAELWKAGPDAQRQKEKK